MQRSCYGGEKSVEFNTVYLETPNDYLSYRDLMIHAVPILSPNPNQPIIHQLKLSPICYLYAIATFNKA